VRDRRSHTEALALVVGGAVWLLPRSEAEPSAEPPLADAASEEGATAEIDTGNEALDAIRERGHVRVGFSEEPPFGFTDDSANVTGYSPSVAAAVFAELGVDEVEAVSVSWDELIPGLERDQFDVVAAGMFITPERCDRVSFATPDMVHPSALLLPSDGSTDLRDLNDVVESEAVLAVLNGSLDQQHAEIAGVPDDRIELVASSADGARLVVDGRADAYLSFSVVLRWLVLEEDLPLEIGPVFSPDGEPDPLGAMAFASSNDDLADAASQVIEEFRRDGTLREVGEPFGMTETELPPVSATADAVCAD
jgi:polar amino acid transport system substrate-binding protein